MSRRTSGAAAPTNETLDLQTFATERARRVRYCAICALSPEVVVAVRQNEHVGHQAIADWLKSRSYLDTSRWTVMRHLKECPN